MRKCWKSRNKAVSSRSNSKRQLEFLGYVIRKEALALEHLSVTGKISGKQSGGRQRLTYIASLSRWMNVAEQELLKTTKDRKKWKSMIADVLATNTCTTIHSKI